MPAEITNELLMDIHHRMVRIRRFEEEAGKLMENGKVPGALHLYVGQEAVAAGVMVHLSNADQITSTHRGHGHLIAKGGQFDRMYAELAGKATGYCKGKGGSMHISNMELGILGANGIVGGGPPIAVGAAFSNKFRNTKDVAVTFFGDGASNEGSFHEAANMAGLYQLPVVFVCENNAMASTPPSPTTKQSSMSLTVRQVTGCRVWWSMAWTLSQFMKPPVKPSPVPARARVLPCSSARPIATTTTLACAGWGLTTAATKKLNGGSKKIRSNAWKHI